MNDEYDPNLGMAGVGFEPAAPTPNAGNDDDGVGPSEVLGSASEYLNSQQDRGFSQGDGSDALNEDIAKLRKSLWNEKAAPEILKYEEDIVDDLKYLIEHQVC
jgi:hypothetical protein